MANIGIITDSTAYLDREFVEKNDIKVVPLKVILEDKSYREGVDIENDEFYRLLSETDVFPTTSQPSAGEFIEAYEDMSKRYDALISIHISGGISGTVESARSAAADMEGCTIEVIDTRYVGISLSMIVDEVVKAREQGKGLEGLKSTAERIMRDNELMFVVETLEYLHKGGRIGGAQALMGSMLKIKPILYIDGTIDALEKVRGSKKALDRLVEIAVKKLGGRKARVGLTYVQDFQRMQELMERVKQELNCDPDSIVYKETGPVIGSHVGPGTVGIGFFPVE